MAIMKIPGGGALQRQLMRQMEKFQQDLKVAHEELEKLRVEATAGGGAVTAVANGSGELTELRISPEAVDPKDVEMLQDLVLAAVKEALQKAREVQEEKLGDLTGGLGIPGLL
jgi:DNA-binding YbaB/EbfC family protein